MSYNRESCYAISPYPEDHPYRVRYRGINIYNKKPNEYKFDYSIQTFPGLYYNDVKDGHRLLSTPKVYPYTNRPWKESIVYTDPVYYESLLDNMQLRPAYTFYKLS